jgi:hypothetical protein
MKYFLLLLFIPYLVHAEIIGEFEGKLVYYRGDIVLTWIDATPDKTQYFDVKMVWLYPPNSSMNIEYNLGQTTATTVTAQQRRAGFHKFLVRACNPNYCSDWADSTTQPTKIIGYWVLPPPIININ